MNAKRLTPLHETVLDLVSQAASDDDAIGYIVDWMGEDECSRQQAAQYIAEARHADAKIAEGMS